LDDYNKKIMSLLLHILPDLYWYHKSLSILEKGINVHLEPTIAKHQMQS